jgi:nucleoside triphosphate pyrophosphatase
LNRPLVLASRSPQRRAILEQLGIPFDVHPADVDELTEGPPEEVVTTNALLKGRAVTDQVGASRRVLSVDTVVALGGRLFGKPGDEIEARSHLARLSGRQHDVWSALAMIEGGREEVGTVRTAVHFRPLDDRMIDWYLDTGEWRDRAGGYAIQGKGAALVESIDGDYWNVVGLPVALMLRIAPQLLAISGGQ